MRAATTSRSRAGVTAASVIAAIVVAVSLGASAASAQAATYRGSTLRKGERVTLTIATVSGGKARISSGMFAVSCSGGRKIASSLDVTVPIRADGTFSFSRTARFSTAVTGAASARETYDGRVSGSTGRLRHTAKITGSRATCAAEVAWTVRRR